MPNQYDDAAFFEKYSQMARSQRGLSGAGEWPTLQKMLPDFTGKAVLDLGCGYGWHCLYAMEQGAKSAVGVDASQKMLEVAREKTPYPEVEYICSPIEALDFAPASFGIVLSSLALHYVEDFAMVAEMAYRFLKPGGDFVFSVEHPVFTAYGTQDWLYGADGEILCWPVDRYFAEGTRTATFLGEAVAKVHHTLTTFVGGLLGAGFTLTGLAEPQPTTEMLRELPEMQNELRRPMMLILSAKKDG